MGPYDSVCVYHWVGGSVRESRGRIGGSVSRYGGSQKEWEDGQVTEVSRGRETMIMVKGHSGRRVMGSKGQRFGWSLMKGFEALHEWSNDSCQMIPLLLVARYLNSATHNGLGLRQTFPT